MILGFNIHKLISKLYFAGVGPGPGAGDAGVGDMGSGFGGGDFGGGGSDIDAQGGWGAYGMGYDAEADNPNLVNLMESDFFKGNKKIGSSIAKGSFSLFFGQMPLATILKGAYDMNSLRTGLVEMYGDTVADAAFKSISEKFDALNYSERPMDRFNYLKEEAKRSEPPPLPTTQKSMDRLVEKINQPGMGSMTGRGLDDYNKWIDERVRLVNAPGSYRADRSQEVGLDLWYKQYLADGTLPEFFGGGKYYTDSAGKRVTEDEWRELRGLDPQEYIEGGWNELHGIGPDGPGGGNMNVDDVKQTQSDIDYQRTLAELSGITLSDEETKYLDGQRDIAIDRALSEIDKSFTPEMQHLKAQQIYNLGTNALGGTIGQEFVKRWQEKEATAKTGALQDIEAAYLGAKEQRLSQKKDYQMDLWGQDIDLYKFEEGMDFTAWQNKLERDLKERIGDVELGAWEDSNKYSAVGNIAGGIVGSDWFGEMASGWF